jgi:hypothetical protein
MTHISEFGDKGLAVTTIAIKIPSGNFLPAVTPKPAKAHPYSNETGIKSAGA